MTYKILDFTPI